MHISFSPVRRDDRLPSIEKTTGDRLRIGDDLFNFNPLNEGDTIPPGVIPCEWIAGAVERIGGRVHITLILPHRAAPSQSVAFPEPIIDPPDGPIAVPRDVELQPEPEEDPADVDA